MKLQVEKLNLENQELAKEVQSCQEDLKEKEGALVAAKGATIQLSGE